MSLDYVWEKFYAAVLILAGSQGTVQERLADAFTGQLIRLETNDLPEELRGDFEQLERRLTSAEPTGGEGSVDASVQSLSDEEAAHLAEQIVEMYDAVTKLDAVDEYKRDAQGG
jgi:hypothetical protein